MDAFVTIFVRDASMAIYVKRKTFAIISDKEHLYGGIWRAVL